LRGRAADGDRVIDREGRGAEVRIAIGRVYGNRQPGEGGSELDLIARPVSSDRDHVGVEIATLENGSNGLAQGNAVAGGHGVGKIRNGDRRRCAAVFEDE